MNIPYSPPPFEPPSNRPIPFTQEQQPPPPPRYDGTAGRGRPWFGFGDVLLGFVFFTVVATVGSLAGLFFVPLDDVFDFTTGDSTLELPMGFLAISLVFQQLGQGLWPFIVSRWKGLGAVWDWRLRMTPADLGIGVGVAVIGLAGATLASIIVSTVVDLTDDSSADNTQILRDAEGTVWLPVILFSVIVGAPVAEELFFRGLTLRAIEKRAGKVWAVIGSAVVFTLPHFIGSDWRGTVTLFGSIFVVGLVLGAATVITNRIAGAVIAHMIFNAFGAAGALGYLDSYIP
jgi:membrane protease YdiL (CAAX protease family)